MSKVGHLIDQAPQFIKALDQAPTLCSGVLVGLWVCTPLRPLFKGP